MEKEVKASVFKCEPDAPLQLPLKKHDQYDSYGMEVDYEQAILLLENLNAYGGVLLITTQYMDLNFHGFPDNTFEVEIFDERSRFEAIASMLDLAVAKKIIEMAFGDESFTDVVPGTDQPWWSSAYV